MSDTIENNNTDNLKSKKKKGVFIAYLFYLFALFLLIYLFFFFNGKDLLKKDILIDEISLSSETMNMSVGDKATLVVTIIPSDATNKHIIWTSNDTSIATVDEDGVVNALNEGNVIITAKTQDGSKEANCNVIVKKVTIIVSIDSVSLNKSTLNLEVGQEEILLANISPADATNKEITWISSDKKVATVNSKGIVKGIKEGKATITVITKDGSKKASCDVTVKKAPTSFVSVNTIRLNKSNLDIDLGSKEQLSVIFEPSNATNKEVTWTSSNTSIATVDTNGVISALKEGKATITVTTKDGNKKASCEVTILPITTSVAVQSVSLDKTSLSIKEGDKVTLKATINPSTATNKEVTWTSSNTSIATVDTNGAISALKEGKATITVTTKDGNKKASCEVTVLPITTTVAVQSVSLDKTSLIIEQGDKVTLKATINPSNATNKEVTWTSSDTSIATVDKNGVVQISKNGTAIITVTTKDGGKTATCNVSLKISDLTNINEIIPTKVCSINVSSSKDIRFMQGVTFYRSNNKDYAVYAGYISDTDPTVITLVDLNNCSIVDKNRNVVMGHANDMTYNEVDNKFYVTNGKKVHSFSIENNEKIIVDSQSITAKNSMSGIAYDKDKNQYYWKAGTVLATMPSLKATYKKIRNVPTYYSNIENGEVKTVDQSIAYGNIDGHRNIYYARTISDTNAKTYYNHSFISVFDADTGKYKYSMHFGGVDSKTLPSAHLEGVNIIGDTIYFGLNFHYNNPKKQVVFYKYTGLKELERKYN